MFVVLEVENGVIYFENHNINKYNYVAVVSIEKVQQPAQEPLNSNTDKEEEQEEIESEL